MKKSLILAAVCCIWFAAPAGATSITYSANVRPTTIGTSSETTLQTILNQNFNNTINAVNDQSSVGAWQTAEGKVDAYAIQFVAGHSGRLGIFSLSDNTKFGYLVDRTVAVAEEEASFRIDASGDLKIARDSGSSTISGFGPSFGFFWEDSVEGYKSYTMDALNAEKALALSYLVPDGTSLTGALGSYFGSGAKALNDNDWVLAFEDHPYGDMDFNDAVFYMEDLSPVPEPGTLLLLGGGLAGLAAAKRRKKS